MKKILIVASVVIFIASISACKTHEKCPAYGKANTEKTEKSV